MGVQIKQTAEGAIGLVGDATGGDGGFVPINFFYTASVADTSFFTADRAYVVKGIRGRVDVAGTGGACTAVLRKVPSGTAGASGTALHSSTYNLVGTANAVQTLSLSTTDGALNIAAGDSLFFDITGTPTSAVGNVTVTLSPAS